LAKLFGVVWAAEGKFERDALADVKRALPACGLKTQSSLILLCAQPQRRKHQSCPERLKIKKGPYLAHIQITFLNSTFHGKYTLQMKMTFACFDGCRARAGKGDVNWRKQSIA
jgi:hypothetical protein